MELASTGLVSSLFSTTSVGELSRKWSFCPTMHRVFAHAAHFVRSFAFVEVRRVRKKREKGRKQRREENRNVEKSKGREMVGVGSLERKRGKDKEEGLKKEKEVKDRKNENKTRKIEMDEEEE